MAEVNVEYAAHFYDMYVKNHAGKQLMADSVHILLLMLQFLLCDLIASSSSPADTHVSDIAS